MTPDVGTSKKHNLMFIHAPEFIYFKPYCAGCDTTFLFFEESWPGSREHTTLFCPNCGTELGTVEENTRLLVQANGNVGDEVFNLILPKVKQEIEQRTKAWEPEKVEINPVADEETPFPYPGLKPSQVTDACWIYAERQTGTYPTQTSNSGKWLVFIHFRKVDALWAKVKEATENGLLGSAAKVATSKPSSLAINPDESVICVYTYDWTDEQDARRVRAELHNLGVTWPISYKADEDTRKGIYSSRTHKRISKYRE